MRMQRYVLSFVVLFAVMAAGRQAWAAGTDFQISATSGTAASVHSNGTNSSTTTFTGFNNGTGHFNVTWTPTGADCGDFAISPGAGFQVSDTNNPPTNPPTTFTVTFTPTAGRHRSESCVFTSNADGQGVQSAFTASGTALHPTMVTSPAGPLDLGTQHVGLLSGTTQTITITNPSAGNGANESLSYTIAFSGANPGDFAVNPPADASGTVTAGGNKVITIRFTPGGRGDRAATVTITGTNDLGNPSDAVNLTGTGTAPLVSTSPATLTYASTHVGNTAATQTVTITNTSSSPGDEALSWTASVIAGSSDYSISPSSGSIPAGSTADITVTYKPTARGTRNGTLRVIGTNEPGTPNHDTSLTGTATAPAQSITWTGSPAALDFGHALVAGGVASKTITIQNTAAANEDLSWSMAISGTNASNYTISGANSGTLTPGTSVAVQINFDPSASGTRTATATITTNDADSSDEASVSPIAVSLTGIGDDRVIAISPGSLSFTNVLIPNPSTAQGVTIRNNGTGATMNISRLQITGADAANFEFTDMGCSGQDCQPGSPWTLLAGGTDTKTWNIRCHRLTLPAGTFNAASLVVTSDADSGTNTIPLSCSTVAPDINVTQTSRDFGNVLIGGTAPTLTFQIQNTAAGAGSATLNYSIVKTGSATFSIGGACTSNCSIAVGGAAVTVTVTFTPNARQAFSGTLTINSDDPDESPKTVTLSGTGIAPVVGSASPGTSFDFGNVDVGVDSSAQAFSISNTGDTGTTLNISSVTLTGANPGDFRITTGTVGASTVAQGASESWSAVCHPTTTGSRTANLHIVSDGFGTSPFDIALTCNGQQAIFSYTPAGLVDFGGVFVTQSSTKTITINNTGNKSGTIQTPISGDGAFTFAIVGGGTFPKTVAAGGNFQLDITFTPVNGNNINTQLTAATDGSPASFVIPCHGDGKTVGIDIAVTNEADLNVTLGDQRVGVPITEHVSVTNTGDTNTVLSLPASNDAHCVVQLTNPAGGYPVTLTGTGTAQDHALFDVIITPDALGGASCQVNVVSTVPSNDNIIFSWNGVAPDIALSVPNLDFTGVDVDASPSVKSVGVQNTGTADLKISACTVTGSAAFSVVTDCSTPIIVPMGQTTMIDVQYDPALEQLDNGNLNLVVDAISTNLAQVPLTGVGVNQHITLPALSYDFPDTFRNPTVDQTPTVQVVVQNPVNGVTGQGAPLHISMAMTDMNTFVVTDMGPYTVDPDGEGMIPVEFHPTAVGTFSGTLTITDDDNAVPMATVQLNGKGIARNVTVTPGSFDIGTIGVGVPVDLNDLTSGGLVIQNVDPDNVSYQVRELAFVDADGNPIDGSDLGFTLVDASDPRDLPAGEATNYDVTLVPTRAGDFQILVAVYLDGDPDAHAVVTLTGKAVDVELQGGGGCSTSSGGGWGAIVIAAVALLLMRRRRELAVAAALLLAMPLAARAEPTRNIDINTFAPAPSTEVTGFDVESPTVGVNGAWAVDLSFSQASNVLEVVSAMAPGMTDKPVSARSTMQVAFAYAFMDELEVGLRLPYYQQSGSDPQFSGLEPANGGALGDLAGHVKAKLLSAGAISAAASLDVTVPTATDGQYAGTNGPGAQVRGLAGWRTKRIGLNANLGFLARGAGDLANITQGNAITYGANAWYRAMDKMWAIGEVFGSTGMGSGGPQQLEGVLGVRYEVTNAIGVSGGVGRGIVNAIGAPAFRGFVMIDVSPKARKESPLVIHLPPPPRDTHDDDGDGIVNADDKCPAEAEDKDGYQDDDGCPDLDNDGDGLADEGDKCPDQAEDKDGFQDDDGCIDADNDGDGVNDVDDKCPMEAEDKDGYQDNDGCDDPDNDADGIPDAIDQCATEQETINGKADDDGCPDTGDSAVMVMPDRIEIMEPVTFDGTTAKISKKSQNVLEQIAATMRANRDFKRMRVTVHVQPRDDGDEALSEKRAKAVRDWLVHWGVEPERLEAKGMGSSRPLVKASKKGAAAINDRVEFIILEKEVK